MLGIVLAIALLILVLSVMNGFEREMRDNILSLVPQLVLKSWQPIADWQSELGVLEDSEGVVAATPFVQQQVMLVNQGRIETSLLNGVDLEQEGRLGGIYNRLSAQQLQNFSSQNDGVLLGSELALKLDLEVGDRLTVVTPATQAGAPQFDYLRVSGLVNTGTEWDQTAAVAHLSRVSAMAGIGNRVHGFRLVVDDVFAAGRIGWSLVSSLPAGYYANDWTMTHGNLYAAIQLSRDLVGMLLLSIIAIASFNVVSSLVLVVIDKQGDIAILRALGATPADVRSVFLLQGLLIAMVGILLGGALGSGLSLWASELVVMLERVFDVQFLTSDVYPIDYIPADLRWENVLSIGLVTAGMCLLAAWYPAQRAARSLPADVLRHE